MGLQFELRDAVPARLAGRARAAGRTMPVASRAVRLGVRPVSRSAAGNWVRGQLTWGALPYSMNRLGLEPDQHAWFMQFQALHRAGVLAGLPGESDWIHLDDFRSPLLWPLLRQAEPLGIAFVTGKREGGVDLGLDARVLLDAARTAEGLLIGASAVIDGRPLAEGTARVVGDHGVYAFRESPEFRVTLAPTPAAVPEDQRKMLVEASRITVPADEVDEFLADWSPKLRGSLGLVSSDGSLELPERTPPELVLTVTFEPARAPRTDDRAHLQWRWSVDGRKDPVSLHGPLPELGTVLAADDVADADAAAVEQATSGTQADPDGRSEPPGPGGGLEWFQDGTIDGADVAVLANELLPALPALGVRVVVQGERVDYERLTGRPHIRVTTMPSDKHDWFDLGIFVSVNGKEIPFTPLLRALAKRDRRMKLVDNSYLSLADPAFDRLKEVIEEARELDEWEPEQPLTVTPYRAALWSEFDQLADETEHDERWKEIAGRLLDATAPADAVVPATVHADLRPYQRDGYAWLTFLVEHGVGGVLADDMGLGKTLQALAMIADRRAADPEAPPFLVVAPTSVVGNWADEAAKFVPSLRVTTIAGTSLKDPARVARTAAASDVVVTSYALLRLDAPAYLDLSWSALLLDEAQFVKNPQSQTHRVAAELRAPREDRDHRHAARERARRPLGTVRRRRPRAAVVMDAVRRRLRQAAGLARAPRSGPQGADRPPPATHPTTHAPADEGERRRGPAREGRTGRPGHPRPGTPRPLREDAEPGAAQGPGPRRRPGPQPDDRLPLADPAADARPVPCTRVGRPRRRAQREARPAPRRTRTARGRGTPGPGVQPVHLVPQDGVRSARRTRGRVRVPRRLHPPPRSRHRPLPGRHRPGVPHLAEGRWVRAHPDRGRHCVRPRPVVEPGRREPGRRPDAPHRADQVRDRRAAHRRGHHRGEGPRARAAEGAVVRHDDRRRRAVRRGVERRGHPVAAGLTGGGMWHSQSLVSRPGAG
ncbi:SNF2-related protein [Curtobacterium sp. MCPF17_052]|nr:SNF2-related protein [Curtobacterium sp. MCPF17_052]WIB12333.1 SNF2-related protein [Curtobacterium sp. MCPF17_052]